MPRRSCGDHRRTTTEKTSLLIDNFHLNYKNEILIGNKGLDGEVPGVDDEVRNRDEG